MRKKVIIIAGIVVLVLVGLVVYPKIAYKDVDFTITSVLLKESGNWSSKQGNYWVEKNDLGNFAQIGYTASETEKFTYSGEVKNGVAYWIAKSNVDLGKCPAGSQWILLMKNDGKREARLPENENCQKLTPRFGELSSK